MAKYGKSKNYRSHDQWLVSKRLGRPKQVWVWDDRGQVEGHWEHTNVAV